MAIKIKKKINKIWKIIRKIFKQADKYYIHIGLYENNRKVKETNLVKKEEVKKKDVSKKDD